MKCIGASNCVHLGVRAARVASYSQPKVHTFAVATEAPQIAQECANGQLLSLEATSARSLIYVSVGPLSWVRARAASAERSLFIETSHSAHLAAEGPRRSGGKRQLRGLYSQRVLCEGAPKRVSVRGKRPESESASPARGRQAFERDAWPESVSTKAIAPAAGRNPEHAAKQRPRCEAKLKKPTGVSGCVNAYVVW